MNAALKFVNENWVRLGLERFGDPQKLTSVLLTPRFQASSRVILLVFSDSKSVPVLAIKVPRLEGSDPSIESEVRVLQNIQSKRPGGFTSVPQVIAFEEFYGRKILIETALVGDSLDPPTVRRDPDFYCQVIVDWLIDLQKPAAIPIATNPDWFSRLVAEPLNKFESWFPLDDDEKAFESSMEIITRLKEVRMPLTVSHGDFSHPNILLMEDGNPGVLDWEQAEIRGLPVIDLFFFLTYVAFSRQRANLNGHYLSAFKSAFFGRQSWTKPYVREYCRQMNVQVNSLTPLFLLNWLRYLTGLLSRLENNNSQEEVDADTASWLRSNRYYKLWRYAVSHASELWWESD